MTEPLDNHQDGAGSSVGVVAREAVDGVVARLEAAIEILTGRVSGEGSRGYALDALADESIEHVQRAHELLQECTGEVGRALWFLSRQASEGADGHAA